MAELRRICHMCNGDGEVENPPPGSNNECPECSGTGYLPTTMQIDDLATELDDIKNKVNDVMGKCNDILEAIENP